MHARAREQHQQRCTSGRPRGKCMCIFNAGQRYSGLGRDKGRGPGVSSHSTDAVIGRDILSHQGAKTPSTERSKRGRSDWKKLFHAYFRRNWGLFGPEPGQQRSRQGGWGQGELGVGGGSPSFSTALRPDSEFPKVKSIL